MTARLPDQPALSAAASDADAVYVCVRVVDTLLREDVRACASRGELLGGDAVAAAAAHGFDASQQWLRVAHLGAGTLWIPVTFTRYMQEWRLARLPLLREDAGAFFALHDVDTILAAFAGDLPAEDARLFTAYGDECRVAIEHRKVSMAERARWFTQPDSADGHALSVWDQRMLHYDRVAGFLDHPYYPTARAKLGFAASDLARYAPEFQPAFALHWLAVPRERHHPSGDMLPPNWPDFADVGLDPSLATSHALVPVHPFVWQHHLDGFLDEAGLDGQVIRAPRSYLHVSPTLSVRSLVLLDAPQWHVKLPLTIRTLGAKNIRTIKPSTIGDGHRIQSLLGDIVRGEPGLKGHVLFTDEANGAHVDQRPFLGYILRRYPVQQLANATVVSVAGLLAETAGRMCVAEELAGRYHGGDLDAWFDAYLALTLQLHLTLWLRYGIALESNQQNSMLVYGDDGLRLLLKDNDAARIDRGMLARRWPVLAAHLDGLEDQRIGVAEALPLAQMFVTITLQLNIAALVEGLAQRRDTDPAAGYARVRRHVEAVLDDLAAAGEDTGFARQVLLDDDRLHLKYLLTAASLVEKAQTGATDVNKFYGKRAPNFLRVAS
ncbi:IucA/IucC family protein [Cupriavidus taiwanensis]|uniref:Putative siderophore biosynthesis protein n=1 Tax=Cupriavidus taiwanensis TaxID=164546 RepID=A0A7Z7JI58_9BURK|nr:IucA/IucC family protein [Cupriavidus taiwanensis]SOZ17473.1 putative siderophore biosynthesis protein [Cupriavidus taiwanensis]SOZ96281.1 putative siderophore biosynthesis protein [Cupriavidus taiwanensis]SPC25755.1 putative siderophore biosynthesis protein [Cupriavidus taiwanensis]